MSAREEMKHALRVIAGIPPHGLTDAEFDAFLRDIRSVAKTKLLTREDLQRAAKRNVRHTETFLREGEDYSYVRYLLSQLQSVSPTPPGGAGTSGS